MDEEISWQGPRSYFEGVELWFLYGARGRDMLKPFVRYSDGVYMPCGGGYTGTNRADRPTFATLEEAMRMSEVMWRLQK